MKTGILLLNFGEPEEPSMEAVVPFLERIFLTNAGLEGRMSPEAARARSRELALERAPSLIEEYETIGGSPLNPQANAQAEALADELTRRGHNVRTYVAHQYAEPLISEVVEQARSDAVDQLIGLPIYPLCGPSTTVAALADLRRAVDAIGWEVPLVELGGWHPHPLYTELRVDALRRTLEGAGLEIDDPEVALVFSVHGTPMKYIEEGSRYVRYAEETCETFAEAIGAPGYRIGYQNHTNRPIEWTQPDIERVIEEIEARHVVVDAISFMHEQSETLGELDIDLREIAEARGLVFHRVPVPHDDARFAAVLADMAESVMTDTGTPTLALRKCICRPGAVCLNGNAPV